MSEKSDDMNANDVDRIYEKYEKLAGLWIHRVEIHLGVPHGTIGSVRSDNDYLKILKMHATVEPLLNQLLERSVTRVLSHPKVHFPGGEAIAELILRSSLDTKVKIAERSELISADDAAFIRELSKVRNHYAHSIMNVGLSIFDVIRKAGPDDQGRHIARSLFGVSKESQNSPNGPIITALMATRFFVHRFARLVHTLVEGMEPPPSLLEGLIGPNTEVSMGSLLNPEKNEGLDPPA